MSSEEVLELIKKNIDTWLEVSAEILPNLENFKQRWNCDDEHDFLHGMLIGQLQGDARTLFRMKLNRMPTDDENKEIQKIYDDANIKVKEIVSRIRFS